MAENKGIENVILKISMDHLNDMQLKKLDKYTEKKENLGFHIEILTEQDNNQIIFESMYPKEFPVEKVAKYFSGIFEILKKYSTESPSVF